MSQTYVIKLDKDALDEYTKAYFITYPRRRKIPIDKPIVPSLNKYIVMNKDARNELKERWEEFVYHTLDRQGLLNLQLEKCKVSITYVFPDKRRSDLDNRVPKMVFDGLTYAGFWKDDNRFVIPEIHFYSDYEARNPHMIIEVETLENEK